MILTFWEIVDMLAMTFFIAYIFKDMLQRVPRAASYHEYDPLQYHRKTKFWDDMKHSAMIAAPALVLHELSHKIAAMSFGATAVMHAPYTMYAIILALKLMRFPLLFFVGGYVYHSPLPPLESAAVSIAGPLMNFLLYAACIIAVRYNLVKPKYRPMLAMSAKLNLFLGIFNMLPFPGFDGQHFFSGIWQAFM